MLFNNNAFIWKLAFFLFLAAFHLVWIWLVLTIILSLTKREFDFDKKGLIVFALGTIILIVICVFDPGGYFNKMMD